MTTTTETSKADQRSAGTESYVCCRGFGLSGPVYGPTVTVSPNEFRIDMTGVSDGYFSEDHVRVYVDDQNDRTITERGPRNAREIAERVYEYLMRPAAERTKPWF